VPTRWDEVPSGDLGALVTERLAHLFCEIATGKRE
jgi:hypothetical protein